jgi:hypothetical protein
MLPPEFMRRVSKFSSFGDFLTASGLIPKDLPNGANPMGHMKKEPLDKWVAEQTSFKTWDEMFRKAGAELVQRRALDGVV